MAQPYPLPLCQHHRWWKVGGNWARAHVDPIQVGPGLVADPFGPAMSSRICLSSGGVGLMRYFSGELIADAAVGEDILGVGRVILQLLPEVLDVHLQVISLLLVFPAPYPA